MWESVLLAMSHVEPFTGTVLVFLSIVLFICASRKYEYRKLNEDIDINIQQEIEQAFERNFDRELELERDQCDDSYIVESIN